MNSIDQKNDEADNGAFLTEDGSVGSAEDGHRILQEAGGPVKKARKPRSDIGKPRGPYKRRCDRGKPRGKYRPRRPRVEINFNPQA
jgi:hypothetical protein